MFAQHTVESIVALACIDRGVTDTEKDALQRVLLGVSDDCKVVRYKDAARMIGLSLPTVKRLVKCGRLTGAIGTGSRALGITLRSIERFGASRKQKQIKGKENTK